MKRFLSLMFAVFATVAMMFAEDPVTIASGTFNGKNATYTDGWTTTGTGVGRTDCITVGKDENITSPEVDLSQYESVTIAIKARRFGSLSGGKAIIAVTFDGEEIGTTEASSTSATTSLTAIEYTVKSLSTGNFVFTCTNATSAGSSHGAGINSIVITGVKKAAAPEPEPEPTTKTIYCKAAQSWWTADGAAVAAYYWGGESTAPAWPGIRMTAVEGEDGLWSATLPADITGLIFVRVNGSGTVADWGAQTADLTIPTDGKDLYTITSTTAQWSGEGNKVTGEWSKYVAPAVPEDVTLYFVNYPDWEQVNAYVFGGSGVKDWPGTKMTKTAEQVYGMDVYSVTFKDNNTGIIFNNKVGDEDASQTADLTWSADKPYFYPTAKDATGKYNTQWYAKLADIPEPVYPSTTLTVTVPKGTDSVFVAGDFNSWSFTKMTAVEGKENQFTLTVSKVASEDFGAYKYCAGPDWAYVELTADGNDVDNRTYKAADEVAKWKAVPTAYKYAKVKEAPLNWTGHYIIAYGDNKPHTAIDAGGKDFVAVTGAPTFVDGDTIQVADGYDVNIRFNGAGYSIQMPDGKYIMLPSSNAVNASENAVALYLNYYKGSNQEGVQIADKNDFTATGTRMMYNNNTYYRSYTDKIDKNSYVLPTLYRLVDEAFDCQDGPYAVLVNGKDVVEANAADEFDGYKQYVAYLSLTKGDSIQLLNASCGAKWMPTIEEGGLASHFKKGVNAATVDTTACVDLYIKMKSGEDKIYIGAGICANDTVRYYIAGEGDGLGWDAEDRIPSKQDTAVLNLKAGDYKMKVVVGDAWKGFEALTDTAAGLKEDGDKNICFTLKEDDKVTVIYGLDKDKKEVFKLDGKFYVKPIVKKELKLVPGANWNSDNAKFAAWIWGEELEGQWTAFFAGEGDTLKTEINADADSIVFARLNSALTEPKWNNETETNNVWNEIKDSINYESLVYTITDWAAGTWDEYVPEVPATYYITGDEALVVDLGLAKDTAWKANAYKAVEDTTVLSLKANKEYKLKVTLDGTWSDGKIKGYSALTKKVDGLSADGDDNIVFKLAEDGDVTVVYAVKDEKETFTVEGDFYVKPIVKKELKLVPGANWNSDNAKFAAWIWGKELEGQWTAFFAGEGDTLKTEINADADSIVFARLNSALTEPKWNNETETNNVWNEIKDSINYESLVYTITDWAAGTWDEYIEAGCNWAKIEWLGDGSPEQTFNSQFKLCKEGDVPGVVNIQKPGFATESGIYVTFPSAAFGTISLAESKYAIQGAGIVMYLSAFTAKETEVSVVCENKEYVFTIYNEKGSDEPVVAEKYYLKNNWNAVTDWTWKEAVKDGGTYKLENVVFGGTGVNYNTTESDEGSAWVVVSDFKGDAVAAKDTVTFVLDPAAGTITATLLGKYVDAGVHTYTVAGDLTSVFGVAWEPSATANDMVAQPDGTYKWEKEELTIPVGAVMFKVCEDHAWTTSYPVENYQLTIAESGVYTITITFDPATKKVEAVAKKTDSAEIDPTVSVKGSWDEWANALDFTLAADKKSATMKIENIAAGTYEFKVILNGGEWRSNGYEYHRGFTGAAGITGNENANMVFRADVTGEYTFTWTFANDSLGIIFPEAQEPELADGFYLIGLNGWTVSDIVAADKFTANTEADGEEYLLADVTLTEGDKFKAVYVENDVIKTWYPDGEDNDYVVDTSHVGVKTIYFRPVYNEAWGGHFYVEANSGTAIVNIGDGVKAYKVVRNGQILIIRGEHTYTLMGQMVK